MHKKQEKIALVPKKEKRATLAAFLAVAILFLAATIQTQYQPFEFLIKMENFWLFIFKDLLPPKISDFSYIAVRMNSTMTTSAAMTPAPERNRPLFFSKFMISLRIV